MKVLTGPLLSGSMIEEQIERERDSINAGVERYWDLVNEAVEKGGGASLKPAERLLKHWFEPTAALIKALRDSCRKGEPGLNRATVGPVLQLIDPKKAAVLALHSLISQCMANPRGVKLRSAAHGVGSAIIAHLNMQDLREQERDKPTKQSRKYDWFYTSPSATSLNAWCRKHLEEETYHIPEYYKVGSALIDCICKAASAGDYMEEVFDPAFTHELRSEYTQHGANTCHKSVGYISLSTRCLSIILEGHEARQAFRPRYSPMIVQPVAWTAEVEGGYIRIRTPLVSGVTPSHKAWISQRAKAGQMGVVFDTINTLNGTAWTAFPGMIKLADELYQRGGDVWNIKGGNEIPAANDKPFPPKIQSDDLEQVRANKKRRKLVYAQNVELLGQRQSFCYRLDQAKELASRDRFYIPHQYDSRGRCFARSQFNHHSDKIWRSMLLFAERSPMTESGWKWLHVQAANAFGIDNVSYDDRVAWAMKHQDEMKACAARPLDETWWRQGESPFEFLAACKAIADPAIGERFPVQRDGTANGLQHFTAMTRDEITAPMVNMVLTEKPGSPYAVVVTEAIRLMAQDAAVSRKTMEWMGVVDGEVCRRSIPCSELATLLIPKSDKDVVKQRAMTKIYGVTEIGARNQIYEKLKVKGLPDDLMFPASQYLAQIVGRCVDKVYAKASKAMEYLQGIARRAIEHEDRVLRWLTPVGFPSEQPYRSYAKLTITTELQSITIGDGTITPSIRKSKQISAFVANTTHGIDGAHMSMTALRFSRPDRPFAQVCDCFWARPSDIDQLDTDLRESMVELHSRDLILEMKEGLEADRPGLKLPDPPSRGTYEISEFRNSRYGFH